MNVCPECGQTFSEGGLCAECGVALVSTAEDPLLGAMLGPYRIANVIGVGGMSRVYKGINPTIRSRVAIKVLSHECADQPDLVERFFAEARAVNLIRNESIVNVLDLARLADGRPYIVMEFLDGASLSRILAQHRRIPLDTLTQLVEQILTGLGAAHATGIVHRDVKPENIFITRQGRGKILDFGLAKLASEQRDGPSRTRSGLLLGTPHYMSPEQAQGRPIDARTDIYAIGVILYEAATGCKPLDGESMFEILRKQVDEEPIPPHRLVPEIPQAYERVILRAMAKDPAKRWPSVDDLARALSEASTGLGPASWKALGDGMQPDPRGPPTTARTTQELPVASRRKWRAPRLVVAGMALAGAAGVVLLAARFGKFAPPDEALSSPPPVRDDKANSTGSDYVWGAPAKQSTPWLDGDPVPSEQPTGQPAQETVARANQGNGPGGTPDRHGLEGQGTGDPDPGQEPSGDPAGEERGLARGQEGNGVPAGEENRAAGAAESEPVERSALAMSRELPREQTNQRPRSWDVTGYLPQALARARLQFHDAVLSRIDADGVQPSGRADLTRDLSFSVLYRFRSPSRARGSADLPDGVKQRLTCLFYVRVDHQSISAYPLEGWSCDDQPAIHMPRCSAREVWRRAAAQGVPTTNAIGTISYHLNSRGEPRWWFSIGTEHQHDFEDDC